MALTFNTPDGATLSIEPAACLIAGWTGRDGEKVAEHIEELAAIGVPRPSTTPLYYHVQASALCQSAVIQVLGEGTGGEAEPVVMDDGSSLWLGLGSDHTDRSLEATSVAHSKAVCAKPLAPGLWPLNMLRDRLDTLRLSSQISADGKQWTSYQEGLLSQIRPISDLIAGVPTDTHGRLGPRTALFCGTVPAIGGVRPTPWFRAALEDPASGHRLTLEYRTQVLPIVA
jgi:hypothetical protein